MDILIIMGIQRRLELIKEIEEKRNSKLIVFITGDRIGLETKIGTDVIPFFQNLLINSTIRNDTIDLMIYSLGGDGVTALTLVALIREYCNKFNVIIPLKAHSAATLIALGANSICMLKSGQLSPVDVSITTHFNPTLAPNQPKFLSINVEDMSGYVDFSKKVLGLKKEESMGKVLEFLTEKVNPLALGAVHRAREKNSKIASTLLEYHMNDKEKIKSISDIITMGLYQHSFFISRKDAKKLQLSVETTEMDLEKTIWELFTEYSDLLKLNEPQNPERLLGSETEKEVKYHRAVIENVRSEEGEEESLESYIFTTTKNLLRKEIQDARFHIPLPQIIERIIEECWHINNEV
jgi:hypothetical protein